MSGARLVLTLALELRRRGGGIGAAALCGGGGQGDALIIKVPVGGMTAVRTDRRVTPCGAAGTSRRWSRGPARATRGRWPG